MNLELPQDRNSLREIPLSNISFKKKLIIALQYGGDEREYAKEFENLMPKEFFDWIVLYEYECA